MLQKYLHLFAYVTHVFIANTVVNLFGVWKLTDIYAVGF